MLQEDPQAHEDEDDAACQLGFGFEFGAEEVADVDAYGGEGEGDDPDEGNGGDDVHLQEGEGDADGQRVDTGGDGHGEHGLGAEGAVARLGLPEGFLNHVGADQPQQDESDPMVNGLDVGLELPSQKIAQQGHSGLEAAKVDARDDGVAEFQLLHREAFTDGHGHGVHGQTNGQDEQVEE